MKKYKIIGIILLILQQNILYAMFPVFDITNFSANTQQITHMVKSLANEAQMIKKQFESIKLQVKNLNKIDHLQWRDIQSLLTKIDDNFYQGKALSYSMTDFDDKFQKSFPQYKKENKVDFKKLYRNWYSSTLDTLHSTLKSMHIVHSAGTSHHQVLSQLKLQGITAAGRMQALQIGNEISIENANQLAELKKITLMQNNAQNTYLSYKVEQEQYANESMNKIIDSMNEDDDNEDHHYHSYHNLSEMLHPERAIN